MKLQDLLNRLVAKGVPLTTDGNTLAGVEVTGLAYDSRKVEPGCVFVAIKGTHVDGHRYIGQAINRGAVAVVYQDQVPVDGLRGPTLIRVPDSRVALSPIAATVPAPSAKARVSRCSSRSRAVSSSRLVRSGKAKRNSW